MLTLLTATAADVGFQVEPYDVVDGLGPDLVGAPDSWDAALVPVSQADLPVDSVVSRWGTGGATNVTGWTDAATDALLGPLATSVDPTSVDAQLAPVAQSLEDGGAVLSLVRQPVVVATRASAAETSGSTAEPLEVDPLQLGRADLTSWWSWARVSG